MTADTITAIKKALEDLREKIGHAYDSGYNRLGQLSEWCADLDAMRPALESLQRENEELRIDASKHAADAETVRRERDAADARESNLRAALTKLERDASEVSRRGAIHGNQWTLLTVALIKARNALSSTGDTHGN